MARDRHRQVSGPPLYVPASCEFGTRGSTAAELYSIQMTMAIGLHIADSTCLRKSGGMGGGGGVRKPTAGSD
jgi:hypothetical protein